MAGYNVLFWVLRYEAKQELIQHIDSNSYSADRTITIKIPITIPYQTDWKSYERVDGEFEHQGEFYKLMKQKLASDTLYIVCIKDHRQKQLTSAMTDFTKLVHDLPGTSNTLKLLGSFQKEYKFASVLELSHNTSGCIQSIEYTSPIFALLHNETEIVSPPPELQS